MNTTIRKAALGVAATLAMSSAAQAALQGRDLDGNVATFEAYYDTALDITWLANSNQGAGSSYDDGYSTTDGRMTWANANTWAANLSFTDGVNVYDNWRLPTVEPINGVSFNYTASEDMTYKMDGSADIGYNITSPNSEMAYMFHVSLGNLSAFTPTGANSGCYVNDSNTCLENIGPFSNLPNGIYWFGLEFAPDTKPAWMFEPYTNHAWMFEMHDGLQFANNKDYDGLAWAVSSGDVGAVPEAQTYVLMLAGLGLVGWRVRRRE